MTLQHIRTGLAAVAIAAACLACASRARADAPSDSLDVRWSGPAPAAGDTLRRPFEYLWVVRTSLTNRRDVEALVARAESLGVRGLLVQVVGRGDAWYHSDLLPRPEAVREAGFDPLGTLLPLAHAAGLEVHAWMNCMLVWSAERPPVDPRHVIRAHPEWVSRLADGRPMTRLTARQRARLKLEGVFLAPGHPQVRTWLARVASELVTRYPVDGLQLDYIRLPSAATGFDPTTRAKFAFQSGVDVVRLDLVPRRDRARVDSLWADFQARQVVAAVAEIRDSVRRVRPDLPLSAAVLADTLTARRVNAQVWWEWLRDGLVDRAFVMCYAPVVQTVLDQMLGYAERFSAPSRIVPGIAVYNCPPSAAAAKIKAARALGYPAVALYSYDSLFERRSYWPLLSDLLRPDAPGAEVLEEAP